MKIYINGRFFTQKITGVQRYAFEIVSELDRIINEDTSLQNHQYIFLVPRKQQIIKDMVFRNIEIKWVGFFTGHLWEQLELPFFSRDGILLNFCGCAPLIKRRQLITIHDAAVSAMPKSFSFLFRSWYRIMYRVLGHNLKYIFTVSNFSKAELNRYYNIPIGKITVTYNGIEHIGKIKEDNSILKKWNLVGKIYVLGVSSMNPSKNFKLVLQAAQELSNVEFIIAGGNNSRVFKQQLERVPSNVKFIGYISDEQLVSLYKNAACFVYPSLYEGFGIPPLEAMFFECPVIVSDRASLPEVCKNGALFCNPYDSGELALKIKTVITNDFLHNELIENANVIVNQYSWRESVKKIVKTFMDL